MAAVIGGRPIAVCANGGVVWDLERDLLLAELTLDPVAAQAVVLALDAAFPGGCWGGGAHPRVCPRARLPAPVARTRGDGHRRVHALLQEPAGQAPVSPRWALARRRCWVRAREQVGPLAELTHSNSADGLLEISAAGVNKASTLARVCGSRTIGPSGDRLRRYAQRPGDAGVGGQFVAVANAHPDVVAAADELTLSNDEDGVPACSKTDLELRVC